SPDFTLSRNWVKLMGSSLIPLPDCTTAKSNTAKQINTTQKIKVLTFEFTKPPTGLYSIDAAPHCPDSNLSPGCHLSNSQHYTRFRAGRTSRGGPKPANPNNARSILQHGPLCSLPKGNTSLLKQVCDFFLSRSADRPIPVTGLPVSQLKVSGQALP